MQGYIKRELEYLTIERLKNSPVVAILGPRQCGKSTLVKKILSRIKNSIYLDLERASDHNKLVDLEIFFKANTEKLICFDEIQRTPEIFSQLRSVIDDRGTNGQIIILGSASRDLIKQSSETLAGRISYLQLSPFIFSELIDNNKTVSLNEFWIRGGFPRSFLSNNSDSSFQWRVDFIRTFLERDIPQMGFNIPSNSISRLWKMIAHSHGQLLNSSKLGESLGVSNHTVRNYIDLLEQTFMVRVLPPFQINLKKRLVKAPKIYIRDSGILHALHEIVEFNDLLGHPVFGASWEGLVIENILMRFSKWKGFFYRTSSGSEIDLMLQKGEKKIAIEIKASSAPEPSKGFYNALNDLDLKEAWIIAPVEESYQIKKGITVLSLKEFLWMKL